MGCAGMKEYSKEAWAWGCTTVLRGKAVNYTNTHIVKKNRLLKLGYVLCFTVAFILLGGQTDNILSSDLKKINKKKSPRDFIV